MADCYSERNRGNFERTHHVDFAVAGGGMSGVCAAITAARLGLRTILAQDRPVLGGPAGQECDAYAEGQLICGASEYKTRDARETGIIEEIRLSGGHYHENGYRSYWSELLRDICGREENLTLLLNTKVYEVTTEKNHIVKWTAGTSGSDLTHHIHAPLFLDCTGDSFIGFEANADFRMGREAKTEFNESLAPDKVDAHTLGSSLFFRASDQGHPVRFTPPPWAFTFEKDSDLIQRGHADFHAGYWWLECGGDMDTISDNEAIYQKLRAVLYGLWDHIKNRGDHGAENYCIDWVAPFPAKRESRRLMGPYILTQNDILDKTKFDDAVSYGGGNVDLHPIEGIFSGNTPCGPEHGILSPGLYQIPFRCFYSRNIDNLMMAGRNISASHCAFSSTRLMATCSAGAQVTAAAAFLAKKHGILPHDIRSEHIDELRRILYRVDHTVPGITVTDPDTLVADAEIKASSSMPFDLSDACGSEPLAANDPGLCCCQSFVSSENSIRTAVFLMNNPTQSPCSITAELVQQEKMCDFASGNVVASAIGIAPCGEKQSVIFNFNAHVRRGTRYYIRFQHDPELTACLFHCYLPGVYRARMIHTSWPPKADNLNLCCRFVPEQRPFEGENVINTHSRGGDFLSMWISDPKQKLPQSIELIFPRKRSCACVELVFDTNLDALNIRSYQKECVKDYRIEGLCGNESFTIAEEKGNFKRFRRHVFPPVEIEKLKLTVHATHGDPSARVYQIRAYKSPTLA